MADFYGDQAAGLRRLFGRASARVIAFAAGCAGVGKTVAIANLAAALAKQGCEVLIVDENPAQDGIAASYGLLTRQDLLDVLQGKASLPQVIVQAAPGVSVLPASAAVRKLGHLTQQQRASLKHCFTQLEKPVDVILVDAAAEKPLSFLGPMAHEVVVVLSSASSAIKEAYSLIKKLGSHGGRRSCRILLGKIRPDEDANAIYRNIATLAAQKGVAQLQFAGAIPLDESLRQATLHGQPVMSLFPTAISSAAFRTMAAELLNWDLPGPVDGEVDQYVQQLLNLSPRIPNAALGAA